MNNISIVVFVICVFCIFYSCNEEIDCNKKGGVMVKQAWGQACIKAETIK